jgi:hypothetical protein
MWQVTWILAGLLLLLFTGGCPTESDGEKGDYSACNYSRELPAVPDAPLPGELPLGQTESTVVDGYLDEYLYDSAGDFKIGIRLDWGGSVIFFGVDDGFPGMNGTNTIDANDTGREVQVALYDLDLAMQNCAWNASCQTTLSQCPDSITYLGWNPVQGGNRCNSGSWVANWSASDGELYISTIPLQWNPNWDFQDCDSSGCDYTILSHLPSDVRLHQTLRFVRPRVVELRYSVQNLAPVDHAATLQEMPTVYTANGQGGPDLWRLFDASLTEIPIDTPSTGGDGFYYTNFTSPEPWATMQNETADYGVAIYYENGATDFQGWQLRAMPFNNMRALISFELPASAWVNARAYLVLGSLATVDAETQWLQENLAPFGVLDAPVGDKVSPGATTIGGWALDNRGVAYLEAVIDETVHVPLTYGFPRLDVCLEWPGYPDCDAVGYSGTHDFGPPQECPHLLEVFATDTDGNTRLIDHTLVTVVP